MTRRSVGVGSDFEEANRGFFVLIFYGELFNPSGAATTLESVIFVCKCAASFAIMHMGHACSSR
jgi:hypothetical protein